jgi:hypothetical protein
MRKLMLILALVVMAVPVLAGVSFAADQIIQCRTVPCFGTGNNDLVYERVGVHKKDRIILRGGSDRVLANAYGKDRDVIKSGKGADRINVADRDTRDFAGAGRGTHDFCIVDSLAELGPGCEGHKVL